MRKRWIASIIIVMVALLVVAIPVWSAFHSTSDTEVRAFYNPYDIGGSWYKGEVHCHSTFSDGNMPPQEVSSRYAGLGFQFIALTDHNHVTAAQGQGLLILGQEYGKGSTESGLRSHMNGINISTAPSEFASQQKRIDSMTAQDGIVVLNHPTALFYAYMKNDMVSLTNYTGMEIINANFDYPATSTWDYVLSRGKMVWGFAADDSHDAEDMGRAWIVVRMPGSLSTSNVVNAIKHGSFYATQGPVIDDIQFDGRSLIVSSSGAESVSFYGKDGKLLKTVDGAVANYTLNGDEGYVRTEVSKDGLKAWTQPLFLGSKNTSLNAQMIGKIEFQMRTVLALSTPSQ